MQNIKIYSEVYRFHQPLQANVRRQPTVERLASNSTLLSIHDHLRILFDGV
jgi:hypothetical protein